MLYFFILQGALIVDHRAALFFIDLMGQKISTRYSSINEKTNNLLGAVMNFINGGGVVSKSLWISLIASFGTMILLYIIGFIANIDILVFKVSHTHTEIALLPIVVGIVVGFITERIIKLKFQ